MKRRLSDAALQGGESESDTEAPVLAAECMTVLDFSETTTAAAGLMTPPRNAGIKASRTTPPPAPRKRQRRLPPAPAQPDAPPAKRALLDQWCAMSLEDNVRCFAGKAAFMTAGLGQLIQAMKADARIGTATSLIDRVATALAFLKCTTVLLPDQPPAWPRVGLSTRHVIVWRVQADGGALALYLGVSSSRPLHTTKGIFQDVLTALVPAVRAVYPPADTAVPQLGSCLDSRQRLWPCFLVGTTREAVDAAAAGTLYPIELDLSISKS
jgi:hypothetical protein